MKKDRSCARMLIRKHLHSLSLQYVYIKYRISLDHLPATTCYLFPSRICDILCKRIEGTMNADVFVSTYGHSFGPFSWMAPSSQDTEYQYQPRTIDFIAK